MDDGADQNVSRAALGGGEGDLRAADLTLIDGVAREDRPAPCPVCGRRIMAGAALATSLGDERRRALGVTLHANCLAIVGREGVLDLMMRAYRDRGE